MNKSYDVIITGARCAGSALSIYLARAGLRVLLLDRAAFPSDTLSTNTFFNNTAAILREIGVMDSLLETNVTPVKAIKFQFEDRVIEGPIPVVDGEDTAYCIRRTYLDHLLLQHARSHDNITVMEEFRVKALVYDGDAVAGVIGEDSSSTEQTYSASLVVGADGRNSTIRRLANSQLKISSPSTVAIYFGYFSGFKHENDPKFEVYKRKDNMAILFPTSDDLYVVVANFPLENKSLIDLFKRNPENSMRELLTEQFSNTTIPARLKAAKLAEPIKGLLGYDNYWYEGMGKGWALVGDAICFKDPGMAQGIHDALCGAKILAGVLAGNKGWSRQWGRVAADYQQAMESEFMVRFYMGCELSKNEIITEQQDAVNKLVSAHPSAIEKMLGIYNYANEPADFENELVKIMNSLS